MPATDPPPARFQQTSDNPPLNNVATTDTYTAATTIFCPESKVLILQVYNEAIYHQLGRGTSLQAMQWLPEEFDIPANYVLDDQPFDAVRVRSAVIGVPGRVTVRPK